MTTKAPSSPTCAKSRKTAKSSRTEKPLNGAAVRPRDNNCDERPAFTMHDVSRLRRTAFDQSMKPHKVTRPQWGVLIYLARHDGMIQSDLGDLLAVGSPPRIFRL